MAKTKPGRGQAAKAKDRKSKRRARHAEDPSPKIAQSLLEHASALMCAGQADEAIGPTQKALQRLTSLSQPWAPVPALELLGEIQLELGNGDLARKAFLKAADLDSDGQIPERSGGGADKFLWLAQLCESGGAESVRWFDKGASVLRKEIASCERNPLTDEEAGAVKLKKEKLANALCGAAEVYMTDLSWESDAESTCEALVSEAISIAPDLPDVLQTLASVRISQSRVEGARSALSESLNIWSSLPDEYAKTPDFPTRISASRLLMEVGMEDQALHVLERLVIEDDQSVEAWYLGGWCQYLLAEKIPQRIKSDESSMTEEPTLEYQSFLGASREWLETSLRLYEMTEYEDERLREHAMEVIALLPSLPPSNTIDAAGAGSDSEWEDESKLDEVE